LIIGVGRLNKAKNYPLLLRAADFLGRQGCNVNILLVGDGPERNVLEHMAKDIRIRMTFTGARYDEEFISLCFASSDVTVIPGAAGLTVIQSLSYGTPVVVHDNHEKQMPEADVVREGINGALFRFGDAGALADAIKRVFDTLPRIPGVAEQCRSTVETTYSPKRMQAVFDHAIAGRSASLPLPNEEIR
jgi:glycosyltransferase involved in cell wall biosynthesis